jgi:hypothetical protein
VPEHVRLVLYDGLGRSVATIFDGGAGKEEQQISFDAKGLVSGAYYMRLEGEGGAVTEEMIVVE